VLDDSNPQVELISDIFDSGRMIVVTHLPRAFEGFLLDLHAEGRRQFLDITMGNVRWGMSIHGLGPDLSVALDHAQIDRRARGPLPSQIESALEIWLDAQCGDGRHETPDLARYVAPNLAHRIVELLGGDGHLRPLDSIYADVAVEHPTQLTGTHLGVTAEMRHARPRRPESLLNDRTDRHPELVVDDSSHAQFPRLSAGPQIAQRRAAPCGSANYTSFTNGTRPYYPPFRPFMSKGKTQKRAVSAQLR
jgi:hypothetical protein